MRQSKRWLLRVILSVISGLTVVFLSSCQNDLADSAAERPNIIYILADDLGYGDLGCYGQEAIGTPHLDRMAAEGLRFTQHYAGSTVCAPSRCSLMTGLHTGRALIRGNSRDPLRPEDVTAAEILQEAGYRTALIGKWGLGEAGSTGIPNRKGFDYFFGYLNQAHAHNYYPEFLWRNEEKVPLGNLVERPAGRPHHPGGVSTNKAVYSHDLFMAEAERFIRDSAEGPFFLYLALTIPHANNEAREKGMEVPELGVYAEKDWPEPQKGHAAMISRMDRCIGRLIQLLGELKLEGRTIVMFSSDNGPHREGGNDPDFNHSRGPLRGMKRDLYEGGIRVPLLVRWPGRIRAGGQTDHVSAFWDLLPTWAELAGASAPAGVDGISFLPILLGQESKQKQHAWLYWEFFEQGGKQAVRMGRWKGVRLEVDRRPDGPIELYDLETDLGERHNIADQHPEIVEQLGRIMEQAHTRSELYRFGYEKAKGL